MPSDPSSKFHLGNDLSLTFREGASILTRRNVTSLNCVTTLDFLALQFLGQTHGQLFGETPADYS